MATHPDQVQRIDAYNLLEFMLEIEKYINQGWSISTENDLYPTSFGSFYTCGLVKVQDVVLEETEEEPGVEPEQELGVDTDEDASESTGVQLELPEVQQAVPKAEPEETQEEYTEEPVGIPEPTKGKRRVK
jgi:hypothetical protein